MTETEVAVDLDDFEVGGTITTGVRLYHYGCDRWFAEWTSREPFPSVSRLADYCRQHVERGCEVFL